jgi:7-keto-8-aminopelargonate synthetase-like enzyme
MPFNFQESFQRELEAHSQSRSLAEIHGAGFCSNNYLELLRHAVLEEARVRAVRTR